MTAPTEHNATLTGKLKPDHVLWIHSMGKRFAVIGMWPDTDDGYERVNAYCERDDNAAVIATMGGVVFVANKYAGVL